jgi:hypothetical protein
MDSQKESSEIIVKGNRKVVTDFYVPKDVSDEQEFFKSMGSDSIDFID